MVLLPLFLTPRELEICSLLAAVGVPGIFDDITDINGLQIPISRVASQDAIGDLDTLRMVPRPEQGLVRLLVLRQRPYVFVRTIGDLDDVPPKVEVLALEQSAALDGVYIVFAGGGVLDDEGLANAGLGVPAKVVVRDLNGPAGCKGVIEALEDDGVDDLLVSVDD